MITHPLADTFEYRHALAWAINARQGIYDDDVLADYAAWYAEECEIDPEELHGLSHQTCWGSFVREFDIHE